MAEALETKSPPLQQCPEKAAWVIDGMALLHCLRNIPETFGELASQILSIVMKYPGETNVTRIDFVCDSYHTTSIKCIERQK